MARRGYLNPATAAGQHEEKTGKNQITLEGYRLKICMKTDGVVGTAAKSTCMMDIKEVLGIEAARYNS